MTRAGWELIALAAVEIGYATQQLFKVDIGKAVLSCFVPLLAMSVVVWYARHWGLWRAMLLGGVVYFVLLGGAQQIKRQRAKGKGQKWGSEGKQAVR